MYTWKCTCTVLFSYLFVGKHSNFKILQNIHLYNMQTNVYFKNNLVFQRSNLPSILWEDIRSPYLLSRKLYTWLLLVIITFKKSSRTGFQIIHSKIKKGGHVQQIMIFWQQQQSRLLVTTLISIAFDCNHPVCKEDQTRSLSEVGDVCYSSM